MSPDFPGRHPTATTRKTLLRKPAVVLKLCLVCVLVLISGCASFRRRGTTSDEIAACRELSRHGASAMEMGQWAQAESLLKQAVDASPKDPEPHRYLAEALWHRGAADEALAEIEEAVKLDSTDASLLVRAGEMSQATGSTDRALTLADQAIRLDPKLASAWALRGRVYWQRAQPDRALADLQRALQFAPDNRELLQDVAVVYKQRGQPARALATLHHLLDTFPPGEEPQWALLLEGQALAELGRPGQAAESLATASKRGPASAEVFYQLAQAQSVAGDYVAATAAVRQALAIDSSHAASQQLLGQLASLEASGDTQRR